MGKLWEARPAAIFKPKKQKGAPAQREEKNTDQD